MRHTLCEAVSPTAFLKKMPVLIFAALAGPFCHAQQDTASIFSQPILLDSFVIRSNFDVNAFIRRVRADTTFYKAFKNMHFVPYAAENDIRIYNKGDEVTASLESRTKQSIYKGCRSTRVLEQHATGGFYKHNGDYAFYTARLFAHIFFAKDTVCDESDIVAGGMVQSGGGEMEKSEYQLKQLIFNPGSKVSGVPFMGARESIFDHNEAEKYIFRIEREIFAGQECYKLSITPKEGYERQALYNEFITWFRVSDYSIIARDYALSYGNLLYDFDVRMKVRTTQIGPKLYPTFISYDGNWHIVSKKRERARFTVNIDYQ